jgi:hypothetical protein
MNPICIFHLFQAIADSENFQATATVHYALGSSAISVVLRAGTRQLSKRSELLFLLRPLYAEFMNLSNKRSDYLAGEIRSFLDYSYDSGS